MKKQTYITPSINVIHIAPTVMINVTSPLNLIYNSEVTPLDAADAASRGSIFWFDDDDE